MCLHGMLLCNSQCAINSHHLGPQHSTTHTACCKSLQQNSNIEVGQETAQRNSGQPPCTRKIHWFFSYMDLLTRGFWIWNGGLKETWKFLQSSNSWSSRNYGDVPCRRQPESHCESITASCESRVPGSPKWEHVDGKTCNCFTTKTRFLAWASLSHWSYLPTTSTLYPYLLGKRAAGNLAGSIAEHQGISGFVHLSLNPDSQLTCASVLLMKYLLDWSTTQGKVKLTDYCLRKPQLKWTSATVLQLQEGQIKCDLVTVTTNTSLIL